MKNDLNITVVHCKGNKDHYYIGRPNVLGNPFTHKENTKAEFVVESRNKAVEEYEKYIRNKIKERISKNKQWKNKQLILQKKNPVFLKAFWIISMAIL